MQAKELFVQRIAFAAQAQQGMGRIVFGGEHQRGRELPGSWAARSICCCGEVFERIHILGLFQVAKLRARQLIAHGPGGQHCRPG